MKKKDKIREVVKSLNYNSGIFFGLFAGGITTYFAVGGIKIVLIESILMGFLCLRNLYQCKKLIKGK